jgi:chromosome partitioning protein
VAMLVETIQKVQERLNPVLEIDGLVATMFDPRTVHGRDVLARLVEAFDEKVFHTAIARTVKFPETNVAGEPITTFATSSGGAYSYRQLAKEVLARCPAR